METVIILIVIFSILGFFSYVGKKLENIEEKIIDIENHLDEIEKLVDNRPNDIPDY